MSVAGSEQWVLSLTRLLDWSSRWLDRRFGSFSYSLAGLEGAFFLSLPLCWSLFWALSAFFLSLSLCFA